MNHYWEVGILMFLCVLYFVKYTDKEKLKDWIEDYLDRISPKPIEEPDEIVELEEVRDMIYDFVVSNQEKFSRVKYNKE
tara:strand:- start:166 stop:402 length:237 start_codon:yes stop_codon:yes gene_type:complete